MPVPDKPVLFLISADAGALSVVEGLAASMGLELVHSDRTRAAVAQAKSAEPDCIILDENIAGADWKELYHSLVAELSYTFVPILVVVDAERAEDAIDSIETGLVDVLVKPPTALSLKPRVKAMLQIKQMHDELDEERAVLQQKLDEERKLREKLAGLNEELKKLSTTDSLTGLANQRYLSDWLKTEYEVVSRYAMPLAAIMMDLDNFKKVNDEHGHLFGDFVLKGIADIIREQSRRADVAARYGGEEFAVILPNTDGYAAANLANRIHEAVRTHTFDDGEHSVKITASFGISTFPSEEVTSARALIEMADRALYAAKDRGRDCVVSWSELDA